MNKSNNKYTLDNCRRERENAARCVACGRRSSPLFFRCPMRCDAARMLCSKVSVLAQFSLLSAHEDRRRTARPMPAH
jgi:hypothetical protein